MKASSLIQNQMALDTGPQDFICSPKAFRFWFPKCMFPRNSRVHPYWPDAWVQLSIWKCQLPGSQKSGGGKFDEWETPEQPLEKRGGTMMMLMCVSIISKVVWETKSWRCCRQLCLDSDKCNFWVIFDFRFSLRPSSWSWRPTKLIRCWIGV